MKQMAKKLERDINDLLDMRTYFETMKTELLLSNVHNNNEDDRDIIELSDAEHDHQQNKTPFITKKKILAKTMRSINKC